MSQVIDIPSGSVFLNDQREEVVAAECFVQQLVDMMEVLVVPVLVTLDGLA